MTSDDDARACVVLDIDGVLADVRHRLRHVAKKPKDWDAFFAAAPEDPLLDAGAGLAHEAASSHDIVYLTGRPERTRDDTLAWLRRNCLPAGRLVMRRDGDRRPAVLTKMEAIRRLSTQQRVDLVLDDDPAVVDAISDAGFAVRLADWMPRDDTLTDAQEREGRT
jgi:hypothetical protein